MREKNTHFVRKKYTHFVRKNNTNLVRKKNTHFGEEKPHFAIEKYIFVKEKNYILLEGENTFSEKEKYKFCEKEKYTFFESEKKYTCCQNNMLSKLHLDRIHQVVASLPCPDEDTSSIFFQYMFKVFISVFFTIISIIIMFWFQIISTKVCAFFLEIGIMHFAILCGAQHHILVQLKLRIIKFRTDHHPHSNWHD